MRALTSLNFRSLPATLLARPLAVLTWLALSARYRLQRRPAGPAQEVAMADPQWGKRGGNDGPPDLDEILKKINQKFAGLFGGGSGGGGESGGPNKAAVGGGIVIAASLAVLVWLATGFYMVDSGKQGIELRFGSYVKTTEAGMNWRMPYPIESVEIVNIQQVELVEVGYRNGPKNKIKEEALMLTEDQNIVDLQFSVQYTLKNSVEYQFNNKDPKEAVRQVAETAMRELVGKSKMDFVLYEGPADIAARAKTLMQQILDRYYAGILISAVTMQSVQPPADVQASFDDAVRAKQDRDRLKNEGEAYANNILPLARGNAARLLEEANGHKQRVIANAQGDASRFTQVLAEYEKAPGVTRERLYLDAMQQILQSTSKVVIDQKGGQNLLYLPLDKLLQVTSGQTAAGEIAAGRAGATAEAASAPVVTEAGRVRDLRSRDGR